MEEVNKLRHKRHNKINNVNKKILGIVDKVVSKKPTNESRVKANCFLEALNEQEADIIKLNEHIEDLLLDSEGELSTEMENLFVFSWRVKNCKQKLRSVLDIKVDSKAQHAASSPKPENVKTWVELPKLVLKKFSVDPLEWNQLTFYYLFCALISANFEALFVS